MNKTYLALREKNTGLLLRVEEKNGYYELTNDTEDSRERTNPVFIVYPNYFTEKYLDTDKSLLRAILDGDIAHYNAFSEEFAYNKTFKKEDVEIVEVEEIINIIPIKYEF